MRVEIGSWTLQKSKHTNDSNGIVPVSIIANKLNVDKVNDQIDESAFTKDVIDFFLREGIVDWQHESRTAPTSEERALAILGKPVDFEWYVEDGKRYPKVFANLTKKNPIVSNVILPHLEADQPVLGASVGGGILETIKTYNEVIQAIVRKILKIKWDHIAIAGRPYVMSDGSAVTLAKSIIINKESEFSTEEVVSFSNLLTFNNAGRLSKSLEAGEGSMEALGKESLEKANKVANDYVMGLRDGSIPIGKESMRAFYKENGIPDGTLDLVVDGSYKFLNDFLVSGGTQ